MVRALTAQLEARALKTPPVWDPYLDAELELSAADADGARTLTLRIDDIEFVAEDTVLVDASAIESAGEGLEGYGRALGEALWTAPMAEHLRGLLDSARERAVGVRIWLILEDPALEGLAWERLHYPLADGAWQPLATSQMVLLCRRVLPEGGRPRWLEPRDAPRALLLMSAPTDLPDIPELQRQETEAALASLGAPQVLATSSDAPPTRAALTAALQSGVDVLHVLAHGQGWPATPRIFLEDERGLAAPLMLDELLELLNSVASPPKLCVFAACESAQAGEAGGRLSLGASVVRGGGVSVSVAMTGLVGVQAAADFTRSFYERLQIHGYVDLAVQEARAQLRGDEDWSAPVLFSRLEANRLLTRSLDELQEGLAWMGRGFQLIAIAAHEAGFGAVADELLEALEALLEEMERGQTLAAEWVRRLARCGMDRAQFEPAFRALHPELSLFAATEGFMDARRRTQRIHALGLEVRPMVEELLGPSAVEELDTVMRPVVDSHGAFMDFLPRFIEELAQVADGMMLKLDEGDADGAIADGRAFTLRAGQALRGNLRLFRRIQEEVDEVDAQVGPDEEA